jgi:hypothetical protein
MRNLPDNELPDLPNVYRIKLLNYNDVENAFEPHLM